MNATKQNSKCYAHNVVYNLMVFTLVVIVGCSTNDDGMNPSQSQGKVKGTVKDENGNSYPGSLVKLSKGLENLEAKTNSQGNFEFNTKDIGTYQLTMIPPLSTMAVTNIPSAVNVLANQTSTVDFVIEPQPIVAHMNFGNVDIFDEIKDGDGNTVTDPNEPLFAANVFDAPLGLLTAIEAPDDHHVTLSEWQSAKGNFMVKCNGNTSTVEIALEGLIPNGTYTFWLAFLNKPKKVGESTNIATDFIFPINPPLVSGTENVVIAGANGTINVTKEHPSCILTQEIALVIPVVYHINGNTFGADHIPDVEEVTHMLAYFQ